MEAGGLLEHRDRRLIYAETHARPVLPLVPPMRVRRLAFMSGNGGGDLATLHAQMAEVAQAVAEGPAWARQLIFTKDGREVTWEVHNEFATLTWTGPVDEWDPWPEGIGLELHRKLPLIMATRVDVVAAEYDIGGGPRGIQPAEPLLFSRIRWFGGGRDRLPPRRRRLHALRGGGRPDGRAALRRAGPAPARNRDLPHDRAARTAAGAPGRRTGYRLRAAACRDHQPGRGCGGRPPAGARRPARALGGDHAHGRADELPIRRDAGLWRGARRTARAPAGAGDRRVHDLRAVHQQPGTAGARHLQGDGEAARRPHRQGAALDRAAGRANSRCRSRRRTGRCWTPSRRRRAASTGCS